MIIKSRILNIYQKVEKEEDKEKRRGERRGGGGQDGLRALGKRGEEGEDPCDHIETGDLLIAERRR